MTTASDTGRSQTPTLIALAVFIFAAVWAKTVLVPLVIASLLMFILTPAVMGLQRKGLKRTYAVLIVVIITFAILGTLLLIILTELHDLAREVTEHKANIAKKAQELFGGGPGVLQNLMKMFEEINSDVSKAAGVTGDPITLQVKPESSGTGELLSRVAQAIMGVLGTASLVIVLTISMLFTREDLRNRLIRLIGHGHLTRTTRALEEASHRISSYLVLQVTINASFGLLFGIGLSLIGIRHALLWGALATMFRFVPYIGTWLAAAFPLIVSIASEGWWQPIAVVAYIVLLGITTNNILEPRLVSRRTGVSPMALVVAAAFWTFIWGWIGLILSTPITVCLCVLGKHVDSLKFLDVLLGIDPVLDPHLGYFQRLLARDEVEAIDLVESHMEANSRESAFEQVIIPALIRAREDLDRGQLNSEDLAYIQTTTGEILSEIAQDTVESEDRLPGFFAFAPRDGREELALQMLGQVLPDQGQSMEAIGSKAIGADILRRVREANPALLCIVVLPPGGTTQARFLCKKVRSQFPDLPILIALWGETEHEEEIATQFKKAGTTYLTRSMKETREQIVALLRLAGQRPVTPQRD